MSAKVSSPRARPSRPGSRRGLGSPPGARIVFVNCTGVDHVGPFVDALGAEGGPFGVYANAGGPPPGYGWGGDAAEAARRHADVAETWVRRGAVVVGACCGMTPTHVAELARRFG
jgi:S-methylmethionine-dependent homocysteine/selenocysteine methylase